MAHWPTDWELPEVPAARNGHPPEEGTMTLRFWTGSVALVALAGMAAPGCAPAFQDARLVGPGRVEITPSFSPTGVSADGESEHIANNFGAHVIVGVHDRLDLGAGFMRTQLWRRTTARI
jgi:hypothetical protein